MKVKVSPLQPHCFAFGGFELQMIGAMAAASSSGVDISPLNPWAREGEFDVLHLWGLDAVHVQSAYWAKQAGKKVVLTALLPYMSLRTRLGRLKAVVDGRWAYQRQLRGYVDRLVVVNDAQRDCAVALYGYDPDKVDVIPNIVDPVFLNPPLGPGAMTNESYVLCTGNVCRRKNQLNLARACKQVGIPLIVVGKVLTGEEAYGAELRKEMSGMASMKWIQGLPAGSQALADLYAAASVVALVSHQETQPICLLEGMAMGKRLLISDRLYARQRYYEGAVLVRASSISSIVQGLQRARAGQASCDVVARVRQECSTTAVGDAYRATYRATMNRAAH